MERLRGFGKANNGKETGAHLSSLIATCNTILSIINCNTAQGRVSLAVLLVHPCPQEPNQVVKEHGGLFEGQEL